MEISDIRNTILAALEESGIYVNIATDEDVDLRNFFDSSLQFISLIVNLEEKFKTDMPDEFLLYDNFQSFNNLCELMHDFLLKN